MNATEKKEMVKIGFKLERDEDDYPPADWEWMWANRINDSTFRVDNIPFFARGVSSGDIVEAVETSAGLIFTELIQPSGHSTIRIVVYRENRTDKQLESTIKDIRQSLRALGCATELSHIPNLIAVDIPPETDYKSVAIFLSAKEHEEFLEYEEASLATGG